MATVSFPRKSYL